MRGLGIQVRLVKSDDFLSENDEFPQNNDSFRLAGPGVSRERGE